MRDSVKVGGSLLIAVTIIFLSGLNELGFVVLGMIAVLAIGEALSYKFTGKSISQNTWKKFALFPNKKWLMWSGLIAIAAALIYLIIFHLGFSL